MRERSGSAGIVGLVMVAVLLVAPVPAAAYGDPEPRPDADFAQIADEVPGFGGAWVEGDAFAGEEEILHLWMVEPDPVAEQRARELLVELFGDRFEQESVIVHHGGLPYGQLAAWYAAIQAVPADVPNPGYMGIREQSNRIVVGLRDLEADEPAWQDFLDRQGIPHQAVIFEQGGALEQLPLIRPWWQNAYLRLGLVMLIVVGLGVLLGRSSTPTSPRGD